jgi:hypothetical protein
VLLQLLEEQWLIGSSRCLLSIVLLVRLNTPSVVMFGIESKS